MDQHMQIAETLTKLLDNQFSIGGFRFGLDPLLNAIPILGDLVATLLSLYLLWIAHRYGLSHQVKTRMIGNIAVDFVLGLIPIAGDVADFFFKSNVRNLAILKEELARRPLEGEILARRPVNFAQT